MSRALHWYGPDIADPPPVSLLRAARAEWGLRLSTFSIRHPARHVCIRDEHGRPVGLYTPQDTKSGVRFGPIYVEPKARGQGHAAGVYQRWAEHHTVVVYAEDGNPRSAAAALAGGLRRWKRGVAGVFYRSRQ